MILARANKLGIWGRIVWDLGNWHDYEADFELLDPGILYFQLLLKADQLLYTFNMRTVRLLKGH